MRLPRGPDEGVLAQTVRLHRDPLGLLREARSRHGDVFTLRLATARPIVVVCARSEVPGLVELARAGEARRRILPMASPRSVFGGDGERHRHARDRVAGWFEPGAVAERREAMVAIAERHAAGWPRLVRLLPRMRALVDELFVRLFLGVSDDRRVREHTVAIRRMLWTPGNPPLSIPGQGLVGALTASLFERRVAPLKRLLGADADEMIPLIMAAQEPAAAGLTWVLDRLAHDPELEPDERVIRETLRLRPPAIAALRRLTAAREVAGHTLPAGVTVMLPIPLLHRDGEAYDEPDAFRPERWSDGPPPEGAYLPFGGGERACLGRHLATAYLRELVPVIVGRRRLRPLTREPEPMVLRGTILVPKRSGLASAVA